MTSALDILIQRSTYSTAGQMVPVGSIPEGRNGAASITFGILSGLMDSAEAIAAASATVGMGKGLPDILSLLDIGVSAFGSYFGGETGRRMQLHSRLPEMTVLGQDIIWTTGEAAAGITAKAVLGTTGFIVTGGNPVGFVGGTSFGDAIDVITSATAYVYDWSRVLEVTPTTFAIGFYIDERASTTLPTRPTLNIPPGQPTIAFIRYHD